MKYFWLIMALAWFLVYILKSQDVAYVACALANYALFEIAELKSKTK